MPGKAETVWTGLNAAQADALRVHVREKGLRMPRSPAERVRLYYTGVAKRPVPPDILAATGRPDGTPEASSTAAAMAKRYGLDLRAINGTGPNGQIVVNDVRAHLEKHLTSMLREVGEGKDANIQDVLRVMSGGASAGAAAGAKMGGGSEGTES